MNLRLGINYCTVRGTLGFRGVAGAPSLARLIPLSQPENREREIFFFFGVDVPADVLPYLPDTGEGSEFRKKGCWHHYAIDRGVFIAHLVPKGKGHYDMRHLLHAVVFAGEAAPRVFLDRRAMFTAEGVLTPADMQEIEGILASQQIALN